MNEWITQKQFLRYLKYTSYFIWNNLDDLEKNEEPSEVDNSFRWLRFDEEDLMIIDFNYENQYSLKDLKATRIIQEAMDIFLINKCPTYYFIKSKNINDAIEETKQIIKDNKYNVVINPVFQYNGAISRPRAFDMKEKCLYSQKFSASTKKKDWCDVFWNYSIANKCVEIKNIQLIILSSGPNRKNEISFVITPTSNNQVSCPVVRKEKVSDQKLSRYDKEVLEYKNLVKSGQKQLNNKKTSATFNSVFIDRQPPSNSKHIGYKIMSLTIDDVIKEINDVKNINEYSHSLNEEMDNLKNSPITHNDIKRILKIHNHHAYNISGALISKSQFTDIILQDDSRYKKDGILKHIFSKRDKIDRDRIDEIIAPISNPKNRVIWYDFEGFSLPFATLDYFPPFQQTVFQVSIIETKNNVIQHKVNKVYDPKVLSGDSFADIINSIYSLQAEVYVVYNKNYENTRIKEMVDWLKFMNHPLALQEEEKANWIIKRTIDLVDLFATRSRKQEPPILLHQLFGMYSIKLLENYIHINNIDLPTKIYKYKSLEIQNGMMAMDAAIERSLGITGNKKWAEKVDALKIYCENDVKAMMMVYELALYLAK